MNSLSFLVHYSEVAVAMDTDDLVYIPNKGTGMTGRVPIEESS